MNIRRTLRASGEEGAQLACHLVRRLLGEKVTAVERTARHVVGPAPPRREHVEPAPELVAPPKVTGTAAQIARGEQLYAQHCALCHGVAARGGVKDLRHMEPATHAAFLDIVLHGARARNGMASFADTLSQPDAEAIHQYLIARANADWEK